MAEYFSALTLLIESAQEEFQLHKAEYPNALITLADDVAERIVPNDVVGVLVYALEDEDLVLTPCNPNLISPYDNIRANIVSAVRAGLLN